MKNLLTTNCTMKALLPGKCLFKHNLLAELSSSQTLLRTKCWENKRLFGGTMTTRNLPTPSINKCVLYLIKPYYIICIFTILKGVIPFIWWIFKLILISLELDIHNTKLSFFASQLKRSFSKLTFLIGWKLLENVSSELAKKNMRPFRTVFRHFKRRYYCTPSIIHLSENVSGCDTYLLVVDCAVLF